jgi:hypothetical protein
VTMWGVDANDRDPEAIDNLIDFWLSLSCAYKSTTWIANAQEDRSVKHVCTGACYVYSHIQRR